MRAVTVCVRRGANRHDFVLCRCVVSRVCVRVCVLACHMLLFSQLRSVSARPIATTNRMLYVVDLECVDVSVDAHV
jgi:hypothetical protein